MSTPSQPSFADRLLQWFDQHGRKGLPWQATPTPYRVWVSEIMLQQTQVAAVIPYYERFMQRFPRVDVLAAAPIDEVLHLWTGLGYYARARNLHAAARQVVEHHGGELPATIEGLQALPGIGRSTAGAILALARGERQPILDGNVKRVLARVLAIEGDLSQSALQARLWAQALAYTPETRVADYTQAIMDLGATLCTRAHPVCERCPMHEPCLARRDGRQAELPWPKRRRARPRRTATLLVVESEREDGRAVLLERRPSPGIWGGLWSPPQFASAEDALAWCRRELGGAPASEASLPPIDHAFTHFDLHLQPLIVRCAAEARIEDRDDRLWYALHRPPRVGLPQPIRTLLAELAPSTGDSR